MNQVLDNPLVDALAQKDILELDRRIRAFRRGQEDEERFRHFRLTRGVYGQRQMGVQMFRTKLPFGKITAAQLVRLADVSEKYTNGNLHITTRQNIQLHYVKLEDSPGVWNDLAEVGITAREACGNTVRNITGSAKAGIDPQELFDISPYVQATFEYFLRNPICQDMGRKIKPAFSSSDIDSAFTYFHDFGFIPRVQVVDGVEVRGFKVLVGGGLGAQSMVAETAYEFLEEDRIIPFMEAAIRVFDRYGERKNRMKARMKFLVQKIGFEAFMELVEKEKTAIKHQRVAIDRTTVQEPIIPAPLNLTPLNLTPEQQKNFDIWVKTNVFAQKQAGFYGVQVRVPLGNIHATEARKIAALIPQYAADDIRLTVNQGFVLKYVRPEVLPAVYLALDEMGFAKPGFDTIADITACPGTDTCALGVTNSTAMSLELERMIREEFPEKVSDDRIKIKISGCMNSCGQHMAANIGFHGSSFKKGVLAIPAMQVVIGGGIDPDGKGYIAEKVIKLPTKRIPECVRQLMEDYDNNALNGEYYNQYALRVGKNHFYELLKPLADLENLSESDLQDWGQVTPYVQEIGVGECAGVALDMIGTIIADAEDKAMLAKEAYEAGIWADSIYHSYTGFIVAAKALLLSEDIKCNTHHGILVDFQERLVAEGKFNFHSNFVDYVTSINEQTPNPEFAARFAQEVEQFLVKVRSYREEQLKFGATADKLVIGHYYKA